MNTNLLSNETATSIRYRLRQIEWKVQSDPRIAVLKKTIAAEYATEVASLNAALAELRAKRPAPKPRWPENTPANVLKVCEAYWSGTEEFHKFRIHLWNDKAVITSYPSGAFWNNGGRNAASACYFCISLTELDCRKPKVLKTSDGRTPPAKMQEMLNPIPQ